MTNTNAFSAWLDALEVPTETVHVCTDSALVRRAAELWQQIEARKASDEPNLTAALGDSGLDAELAEVQREIEAQSLKLTFRSPAEDEMLHLDKAREKDPEQWARDLIALASVEPKLTVEDVDRLRSKVDRATYVTLFNRVREIAVTRSLTLPFSLGDSGRDRT